MRRFRRLAAVNAVPALPQVLLVLVLFLPFPCPLGLQVQALPPPRRRSAGSTAASFFTSDWANPISVTAHMATLVRPSARPEILLVRREGQAQTAAARPKLYARRTEDAAASAP